MAGIEFAEVAARLTAEEFARHELKMRGDRAQCPFHHGERFNLKFFPDGRCYCHVCHKTGDSVTLAAATWGVTQLEAANMLNDVFKLSLEATSAPTGIAERRKLERQLRDLERQQRNKIWGTLCDQEREAGERLKLFTAEDAEKPEFTATLRRFCEAQDKLNAIWAGVYANG